MDQLLLEAIFQDHKIIGWDMDETLINGPHSKRFRKFINNHPEKKHCIITFRDKVDANNIWSELLECDEIPLLKKQFSSLSWMPDYIRYHKEEWPEDIQNITYDDILSQTHLELLNKHDFSHDDFNHAWTMLRDWKALECREVFATILVDDLVNLTQEGCKKYNIDFLNSVTLEKNLYI
jgi:hypothetical protein